MCYCGCVTPHPHQLWLLSRVTQGCSCYGCMQLTLYLLNDLCCVQILFFLPASEFYCSFPVRSNSLGLWLSGNKRKMMIDSIPCEYSAALPSWLCYKWRWRPWTSQDTWWWKPGPTATETSQRCLRNKERYEVIPDVDAKNLPKHR